VKVAEHAMAGAHERSMLALHDRAERLAVAVEDGDHQCPVIG